jgi:hypothetical protein
MGTRSDVSGRRAVLRERGVTEPAASLAAQPGIAVFHVGFGQWSDPDNTREFSQIVTEALVALKRVIVGR